MKKYYHTIIFLLPILAQYKIGKGLDFDVIVMLGAFVGYFFAQKGKLRIYPSGKYTLVIISYIILITVLNIAVGIHYSPVNSITLRMFRYCVYLFVVFVQYKDEYFDYSLAIEIYRKIAYIATIYIIVQAIAYYTTGITLPNKIGAESLQATADIGRLRSFYSEPADMAYSIVPFIVCMLFGKNDNYKHNSLFDAAFVSIGIFISTSGQGVLAVLLVWGLWLFFGGFGKNRTVYKLFGLLCLIIILWIFSANGLLDYSLGRITATGSGGAIAGREGGYLALKILNLPQLFFGTGFGNFIVKNEYGLDTLHQFVNYSSIAEFLFTLGILGTLLFVLPLLARFQNGNKCARVLLIALLFFSAGGCPMSGKYFPLWLTLAFAKNNETQKGALSP